MSYGSAVLEAIEIKKFAGELSDELIRAVVEGYTKGEVPDYQMSALLMAIFIHGMDFQETLALTCAMANSGKHYSFPECVDKHSTGGVGDKVSLTALPMRSRRSRPLTSWIASEKFAWRPCGSCPAALLGTNAHGGLALHLLADKPPEAKPIGGVLKATAEGWTALTSDRREEHI